MNINKNFLPAKTQKTMETNINEVSRISHGTTIRGDLSSSTDIRVDGQVDGTLYSEGKVVVGESAQLSGKLFCTNVDFWGKMDGDFYVKDQLSLKSSAVVNGNIHVRRLQVDMGAQINGTCHMITEDDYDTFIKDVITTPVPSVE